MTNRDDAIAITLATADAWEEVDGPIGLSEFLRILHTTPKNFEEAQKKLFILRSFNVNLEHLISNARVIRTQFCDHKNVVDYYNVEDDDNYVRCLSCEKILPK